jgi:hypothetical protein
MGASGRVNRPLQIPVAGCLILCARPGSILRKCLRASANRPISPGRLLLALGEPARSAGRDGDLEAVVFASGPLGRAAALVASAEGRSANGCRTPWGLWNVAGLLSYLAKIRSP